MWAINTLRSLKTISDDTSASIWDVLCSSLLHSTFWWEVRHNDFYEILSDLIILSWQRCCRLNDLFFSNLQYLDGQIFAVNKIITSNRRNEKYNNFKKHLESGFFFNRKTSINFMIINTKFAWREKDKNYSYYWQN